MTADRIDRDTADRLLSGRVAPADAPPGYAEVTALLHAAGTTTPDRAVEAATVSALVAAISSSSLSQPSSPRRKTMLSKLLTAKALAAAGVAVLSASGVAAAAGSLPGPVQDIASHTLDHVGVNIPTSSSSPDSDSGKTASTDKAGATTTTTAHDVTYGLCVAEAAHDRNGAQPQSSVFPSSSQCTKVTAPGNSADHRQDADHRPSSSTTSTTAGNGTSPSTTVGHGNSGSHGHDATTSTTVSTGATADNDHGSPTGTAHADR